MRPKKKVVLSPEQRIQLQRLLSAGKHSGRVLTRARILLLADQGQDGPAKRDDEIYDVLGSAISTIARVRSRYANGGLDGALYDRKSPQVRRRVLDGAQEAKLIALACSKPPEGREGWSMVLLADRLVQLDVVDSIDPSTVWRTLKKTKRSHG
jgi:hypothetical protein